MEKITVFLAALAVVVASAIVLAWPVQWLWNNALVGAVDGISPIGFWQALGVFILCNVLFKGTNSK